MLEAPISKVYVYPPPPTKETLKLAVVAEAGPQTAFNVHVGVVRVAPPFDADPVTVKVYTPSRLSLKVTTEANLSFPLAVTAEFILVPVAVYVIIHPEAIELNIEN